ncbi:MAG: Multisubunit Na+/H+ antiporter, MnhD subunit [Ignavibacteriae bacterium]|nr:MAG: Multisubunit Na+/H+ antiporter, MnhD subunit [Ignavibacteriota bacterium]
MNYNYSLIPFYAVIVSLVGAILILISSRKPNLREFWTISAAIIKFILVFSLVPEFLKGNSVECEIISIASGVSLAFRVDGLGLFFAIVASGLWILTSFYSIGYMRGLSEHKQTRYFASFAIALSATMGVAFAANLVTFVFFYEILTISTYPLVIHKETPEAISAGRKYLAYTLSAGVILIIAIAWIFVLTGNVEFNANGILKGVNISSAQLTILFILLIIGTGVKAAIIPLHSWLPTAMVAPTPVSALLHAVAVVKAGVFGVLRIVVYVMGFDLLKTSGLWIILATFSAATIVIASLIAFSQDNLKKRLAYSTIAHLSYIILGASLLNGTALLGGILHLAAHATLKITLFFVAGAIYVKTHIENISELDGIGYQMPLTMGAFAIGALGLAGIPPLNGFISKFILINGTLSSAHSAIVLIYLLSGLLNAGYFFPIVYRAFFIKSERFTKIREVSLFMLIPILITAGLSLLLGLFPDLLFNLFHIAQNVSSEIGKSIIVDVNKISGAGL